MLNNKKIKMSKIDIFINTEDFNNPKVEITKRKKTKTKWEQKDQIQKLIRIINDRITDIQVLKGGFIMSNKVLRVMLSEHPQLEREWHRLHLRKDRLRRLLWKLP